MIIQRQIDKERVDDGDKEVEKAMMMETKGEIGGEATPSELLKDGYGQKERHQGSFKQTVRITPDTSGLH